MDDLQLSMRARKALQRLNVRTVRDLSNQTAEALLNCKNFGRPSLKEIEDALGVFGVTLRRSEAHGDGFSAADPI